MTLTMMTNIPPRHIGAKHHFARLDDTKVTEMRAFRAQGWRVLDLAAKYNVHSTTVSKVVQGRTWRHLLAEHGE